MRADAQARIEAELGARTVRVYGSHQEAVGTELARLSLADRWRADRDRVALLEAVVRQSIPVLLALADRLHADCDAAAETVARDVVDDLRRILEGDQ